MSFLASISAAIFLLNSKLEGSSMNTIDPEWLEASFGDGGGLGSYRGTV